MGGSCEMNCDLVEDCCQSIAARARETHRSREAQRRADEATIQRLIANSKRRLASEVETALQRLQASGRSSGMQVRVLMGYKHCQSLVLRRDLGRMELTKEHTSWQVHYAQGKLSVLLLSDGLLYDDWCVQRSIIDNSPILAKLSSVSSLDTSRRDGLFINPRRVRIQRHVDQIVQGLQQLGT